MKPLSSRTWARMRTLYKRRQTTATRTETAEARRLTGPLSQKLAPRQIDRIVAAINAGHKTLPGLDLQDESDYVHIGSFADSGSAAHVADLSKQFPGAILRRSEGQTNGVKYVSADGGEIHNNGESDVAFRAPDGSMRKTTFQNAPCRVTEFLFESSG